MEQNNAMLNVDSITAIRNFIADVQYDGAQEVMAACYLEKCNY